MTHDHLANGGNVKLSQAEIEYERRTPLSERLGIAADSADDREARWSDQAKALEDRVASLEAAAETTRVEHAAALVEAERRAEKAVELTAVTHAGNVKLHADRETLRAELAEHAAALGLATARIRELEIERDELLGLAVTDPGALKPCPFCGGEPLPDVDKALRDGYEKWKDDPDAYAYNVRCRSCAATGGWAKSETGYRRLWNTRAIVARIEKATKGTT